MKVTGIETLTCDAGWRNYYFLKLLTDDPKVVGWSEYDEGFGSPGVGHIIQQLGGRLVDHDVFQHERFFALASALTRPAPGSVIAQAIGAIENALLDAKAKALGVPCYELLGGKMRDSVQVYWSHCATWRINHPKFFGPPITDLAGVTAAGVEAREKGFSAVKTNLFVWDEGDVHAWRPGFAVPFQPPCNVSPKLLRNVRRHLEALREGVGPDVEILLDLNYNAKPEGMLRILRELEDFPLFWLEVDNYDAQQLGYVRSQARQPIASCETAFGQRGIKPFLDAKAIDIGIIDVVWNGAWQSMKMAALCDTYEVNVAPHNFYGDLCTMMNLHFAAAVPNLRIMEADIDRLSFEHELFTHQPEIRNGQMVVPDRPGWGTDPIEAALKARPPKGSGGLLQYKRK